MGITKVKNIVKKSPELIISLLLLIFGIFTLIFGILVGTTDIFISTWDYPEYIRISVALAGFSVLLLVLGVFVALPSRITQKIGTAIGFVSSCVGIYLFFSAYPNSIDSQMFTIAITYAFGTVTMLTFLFVGVTNMQISKPERVEDEKNTRRELEVERTKNEPKSTSGVIREIVRRKIGDSESGEIFKIDDEVVGHIKQDMRSSANSDEVIEDIEIKGDNLVTITKSEDLVHTRFSSILPEYVKIDERDDDQYHIVVLEEEYNIIRG